ncbi:MAG: YtxH domain-containing protein [Lacisediminihabitans sp.]
MRGKILLVVGLAAGYVLGARAGRERYEDIKRAAGKLWNDPRVQHQVRNAGDFAKDKAPDVVEFIADGAKKVVAQVGGSSRSGATKRSAASTAKASTAKASTAKASTAKSGTSTTKPASSK